ncbi:MAG: hypothetical protein CL678_15435 [Bdellovibrionaceae bacterium]|nr:hypothetical protein [Pseudobdellovibrionaceae bacterium]
MRGDVTVNLTADDFGVVEGRVASALTSGIGINAGAQGNLGDNGFFFVAEENVRHIQILDHVVRVERQRHRKRHGQVVAGAGHNTCRARCWGDRVQVGRRRHKRRCCRQAVGHHGAVLLNGCARQHQSLTVVGNVVDVVVCLEASQTVTSTLDGRQVVVDLTQYKRHLIEQGEIGCPVFQRRHVWLAVSTDLDAVAAATNDVIAQHRNLAGAGENACLDAQFLVERGVFIVHVRFAGQLGCLGFICQNRSGYNFHKRENLSR